MNFLDVSYQVVSDSERFLANVANLVFDIVVNAQDVALQVGRSNKCLVASEDGKIAMLWRIFFVFL